MLLLLLRQQRCSCSGVVLHASHSEPQQQLLLVLCG